MKDILVITPYYEPDIGPSAPIFTMLCEALVKRGHKVTCITTRPHYTRELHDGSGRFPGVERTQMNGVEMLRIGMPFRRGGGVLNRLMHQTAFNIGALLASFRIRRPQSCIIDGPVLWSGLTWLYWCRFRKVEYLYNQHDIFPDVAWRLGWLSKGKIFKAWDFVEKTIYLGSKRVLVLGSSSKNLVVGKGVPTNKVDIFPVPVNFMDVDAESASRVDFRKKWGLEGRFVVFYGGNLGQSQRSLELAEAAATLRDHERIHFVFVGEGDQKSTLEKYVKNEELKNVSIFPFQERRLIFDMYRSFDCGIVPLSPEISGEIVPSKAVFMMAAAMPILAWVGGECELANVVSESGCGRVVSGNVQDLAAEILQWSEYGLNGEQYGRAGSRYAREKFDIGNISRSISEIFQE